MATLDRLGDVDLVVMRDPAGPRPVRVLLATKVAASVAKLRRLLTEPANYRVAVPAFRRANVVARREQAGGVSDVQVAWELEVPAWNMRGRLWLRPRMEGVDLELAEGDWAPGIFHLRALPGGVGGESVLTIDGYGNLSACNWVVRRLVQSSPLVEPAATVVAAYVLLRGLAGLAERGGGVRPRTGGAADLGSLDGINTGRAAILLGQPRVFAAVRRQAQWQLDRVEVAVPIAAAPEDAAGKSRYPESFRGLPGWHRVSPAPAPASAACAGSPLCWAVDGDLPFFSLGGIWEIVPQPWRARMVAGDTRGAVMGLDFVPGPQKERTVLVMSQHPRIDQAGYLPRRLIAAEPLLEPALALALTVLEAVSLAPALQGP
ncbi:MAG: hypothetical protein ABSB49_18285 [Polyangia bacterium]